MSTSTEHLAAIDAALETGLTRVEAVKFGAWGYGGYGYGFGYLDDDDDWMIGYASQRASKIAGIMSDAAGDAPGIGGPMPLNEATDRFSDRIYWDPVTKRYIQIQRVYEENDETWVEWMQLDRTARSGVYRAMTFYRLTVMGPSPISEVTDAHEISGVMNLMVAPEAPKDLVEREVYDHSEDLIGKWFRDEQDHTRVVVVDATSSPSMGWIHLVHEDGRVERMGVTLFRELIDKTNGFTTLDEDVFAEYVDTEYIVMRDGEENAKLTIVDIDISGLEVDYEGDPGVPLPGRMELAVFLRRLNEGRYVWIDDVIDDEELDPALFSDEEQ